MNRLSKMVFVIIACTCLSQDILFLTHSKKEVPKVNVVKNGVPPKTNKNIDDLFINF